MKLLSLKQSLEIMKNATFTRILREDSLSVTTGLSDDGRSFLTVDTMDNKIVVITTTSSGKTFLVDTI